MNEKIEEIHNVTPIYSSFSKTGSVGKIIRTQLLTTDLLVDLDETVRRVVTPSVTLPGTEFTSIQKETHEITTMRIVGK